MEKAHRSCLEEMERRGEKRKIEKQDDSKLNTAQREESLEFGRQDNVRWRQFLFQVSLRSNRSNRWHHHHHHHLLPRCKTLRNIQPTELSPAYLPAPVIIKVSPHHSY